jgi:Arc/MetJ-type ribon-helix-helix transcriptional regulator
MSEETPFKSIKITLSEEALDILAELRKKGYFRSDSMTIEESIRALFAMSNEMEGHMLFLARKKRSASPQEATEWLKSLTTRLARFMSRDTWTTIAKQLNKGELK